MLDAQDHQLPNANILKLRLSNYLLHLGLLACIYKGVNVQIPTLPDYPLYSSVISVITKRGCSEQIVGLLSSRSGALQNISLYI